MDAEGRMSPEAMAPRADPREPAGEGCMREAVELAVRAPSLHNTQPWRWRIWAHEAWLYADRDRRLAATDPDRRDLLISCGTALHHLHVALAGCGQAVTTERFPDVDDRDLVARIRLVAGAPDQVEAGLQPALLRRRSDRRRYGPHRVEPTILEELGSRARRHGVNLVPVLRADQIAEVADVLGTAADAQRRRPGYVAELMTWTHRYAGAHDGVPTTARPKRLTSVPAGPVRVFPPGRLVGPAETGPDGSVLVVLCTEGDDPQSQLRAGEATSAVLLAAVRAGLATVPLSQGLELPETRSRLARTALHVADYPQMIIRLGYPPDDRELPETPRRRLEAMIMPS
ncbi:Acg family FMN-binding oxidoreductase [Pseudonocardia parietis]|uniref:Nitroreductase n=1 Tax=Pseudonocardia parietis TaxID=570936 RepID=A0ABS4VW53_9PSEU|nr:NAD(P)H nitroreductase [Pseudonocardia parietis]MBP2368155.1 nitroreductase [Pseudonocardia parietis]